MKIFIEHRGSVRHPWFCLFAESADEKRELEKLFFDAQPDHGLLGIEWQQQNYKLMFMLEVDQVPETR